MLSKYRWLAVAAVGLSIFLSALDATIVALALPAMAGGFRLSASLTSLIILSYTIPLTVLILPCGMLISRFRVLPLFLIAVLGFGLGSVICGLATNFPLLIVGRVIQGCAGALIGTQGLAVAAVVVAPTERGRAMGLIGSLAPLGGIAGPGIGGQLLARWHWSVIFFVNVPICLLATLLGLLSLRGISLGERQPGTQSESALSRMGTLLRHPQFLWSLLAFLSSVTLAGALYYLLPFNLSNVQHLAPSTAGLILLCMPLGMGVVGLLGGYLTDRYGARPFTLAGAGLILVGALMLSLALMQATSALDLSWRLLLVGVGLGLFNGPNQTLLMSAGTRETMGAASALSNLSARLGSVLGPLLLGAAWFVLPATAMQMSIGVVVLVTLSASNVLCAWLVRPETRNLPHKSDAARQEQGEIPG
ncbi:MAG: MFS transporter [Ktedonobacteraceae bacterium]|nr:MFS transporter [Ktedonobacteraceae bacterium]